jgi:hypothetical protein
MVNAHMTYVTENLTRLDQIDKRLGQQVAHLFWKEMDGRLQRAFKLYFPTCTHHAHTRPRIQTRRMRPLSLARHDGSYDTRGLHHY